MIKIICVGSLKEKYLKEASYDYHKRLNKYHKVEIIEVKDSNIMQEAKEIVKYIKDKDYVVTLALDGKKYNTLEFKNYIDKSLMIYSNIVFIIGGSEGLNENIKKIGNDSISFSNLTFPHGLFRVILLEQLYRCFKIINGESYHK